MSVAEDGLNNGGRYCAYRGHIVSPTESDKYVDLPDGALIVDERGKIAAVGTWSRLKRKFEARLEASVDYGSRLIMPGFVDMHLHLPQISEVGRWGSSLLDWLGKYIFPAEAKFRDNDHAARVAEWFFAELARNGTTLAAVFTTVHAEAAEIAFRVAAGKGNRVIMGKVMMDANCPDELSEDVQLSLLQSEELCRRWHGYDDGRLLYAFTPRFAITSSAALLSGAAGLWSRYRGSYMHTHLAENRDEVEMVARQFPAARSYTDVYRMHGLLGRRSIFAHAIHLDDEDLRLLAASRSGLAHCPSSNFFLKSGAFPYSGAEAGKARFGLGSDVAAGPEMSMFRVMKDAAYMQSERWLAPRELFYRATLGGARALHLDRRTGSLKAGKDADFIVVDPGRKPSIPPDILQRSTDEILSSLIYLGDDRLVMSTFVRGREIYRSCDDAPSSLLAGEGVMAERLAQALLESAG